MSATTPPSDAITTSNPTPAAPAPEARLPRRFRLDPTGAGAPIPAAWAVVAWAVLAGGFVLIGGGNLDPGPDDARLGLAAGEGLGPFGQVYGGWDPSLWPVQVLAGQAWARGEGGWPSTASIRWPAAVAGLLIGLILTRRLRMTLGRRAGVLGAACLFGSVALMHRTADAGLDPILGLAVVGALDRILARGSDWVAGLWAALAVLAGGWPPLAMILLPILVLGRPGKALSHRLLLPPLAAFAAWSAWALAVAPPGAWAAALALPLTRPNAWWLVPSVLLFGLPWSPLAALAAWPSVRDGWAGPGRALVLGWLQVAGVALLAGTLIPGMAVSARMTAIVALAFVAAAVADRVWAGVPGLAARRTFLVLATLTVLAWAAIAVGVGGYLAAAVSYYRPVCVVLVITGYALAVFTVGAAWKGLDRAVLASLLAVAICLKLAYWGVYAPEWNYRIGQGAWGRAIGQWVLPNRPIYTFTTWPHHLMFHTGRPVRQLTSEVALKFKDLGTPQYVLLHDSEFTHWPERAPALVKIREFQDERGRRRVLARTEGDLGIRPHAPRWDAPDAAHAAQARRPEPGTARE